MYSKLQYKPLTSTVSKMGIEADPLPCARCARLSHQRWYHWAVHLATILVILYVLLIHIEPSKLAATCWDLHNYYCKFLWCILPLSDLAS